MKTIYIETSIPSFFYETRKEVQFVAMRQWTRDWWNNHSGRYELVSSQGVLAELRNGDYPSKSEIIALLDNVMLLDTPDEIADIIDTYILNHLMPQERLGDALHLALASYHKCDFLLTWNCST